MRGGFFIGGHSDRYSFSLALKKATPSQSFRAFECPFRSPCPAFSMILVRKPWKNFH
jgi:hypothetical protein